MGAPQPKQEGPKQEIQLEETDFLRLENFDLKLQAIQREGDMLMQAQRDYLASLAPKYGVDDIRKYSMDRRTGAAKRINGKAG